MPGSDLLKIYSIPYEEEYECDRSGSCFKKRSAGGFCHDPCSLTWVQLPGTPAQDPLFSHAGQSRLGKTRFFRKRMIPSLPAPMIRVNFSLIAGAGQPRAPYKKGWLLNFCAFSRAAKEHGFISIFRPGLQKNAF